MVQPIKYEGIRRAFENGGIKELNEIEVEFKASNIAKVLGINYNKATMCLDNPWKFTVEELGLIANHVGVPLKKITDLVNMQYEQEAKGSDEKLPIRSSGRNRGKTK